jgi:chromosome partitioning protein
MTTAILARQDETDAAPPRFITEKTLAERWDVHPRTIQRMIQRGELHPLRIHRRAPRFALTDIEAYEARRHATTMQECADVPSGFVPPVADIVPRLHRLPRVICLANAKGGVGKTVLSVNLAAALGELGHRVLFVDADPQANATRALGHEEEMTEPAGLAEVLLDRRPLADVTITSTNRRNVHLVPATHRLDKADIELPAMNGFEFALRKAIAGLPEGDYRYVIIDTHPGFTVTTRVALAASTDVLIPAKPSLWPMRGVVDMAERVRQTSDALMLGDDGPRILGAVMNMVERPHERVVEMAQTWFGDILLPIQFPKSRAAETAENNSSPILRARGGEKLWALFLTFAEEIEASTAVQYA